MSIWPLSMPIRTFDMLLQVSLLLDDLVCLNLVIHLQCLEAVKANTTLRALAHLHDVLLYVFEGINFA